MTVKELATFTGKTERTIQRWIEKAGDKTSGIRDKMSSSSSVYPADYSVDEVELILNESKLGQNAVLIIMENARRAKPASVASSAIDYEALAKCVAVAVTTAITPVIQSIQPAQKKALPAPVKTDRASLNQIKAEYASLFCGGDHRSAWQRLYEELYYRCGKSVRVLAENRGVSKLDVIEQEGLIPASIGIFQELMGVTA